MLVSNLKREDQDFSCFGPKDSNKLTNKNILKFMSRFLFCNVLEILLVQLPQQVPSFASSELFTVCHVSAAF